jgi:hypothetical protein
MKLFSSMFECLVFVLVLIENSLIILKITKTGSENVENICLGAFWGFGGGKYMLVRATSQPSNLSCGAL